MSALFIDDWKKRQKDGKEWYVRHFLLNKILHQLAIPLYEWPIGIEKIFLEDVESYVLEGKITKPMYLEDDLGNEFTVFCIADIAGLAKG